MVSNKIKNIALIILLIVTIVLGYIVFNKQTETIEVEVPIKIEVPVPVVEKEFDTIFVPKPISYPVENPLNKELADNLKKANNLIDSLKAYKDFAIKRQYKETFEDSIQTISVSAETTGTLDKLQATYKTKPRVIKVDTTIKTNIKTPYVTRLGVGGEVGFPLDNAVEIYYNQSTNTFETIRNNTVFKANIELDTKKIIYKIGIDTDKRIWSGLTYKF